MVGVAMREVVGWSAVAGLVVRSRVGAVCSVRGSGGVRVWSSGCSLVWNSSVNVTTFGMVLSASLEQRGFGLWVGQGVRVGG